MTEQFLLFFFDENHTTVSRMAKGQVLAWLNAKDKDGELFKRRFVDVSVFPLGENVFTDFAKWPDCCLEDNYLLLRLSPKTVVVPTAQEKVTKWTIR